MDARHFIARMCSRFQVSLDFGRRLQPLVERAARAEPDKQRRLLEMIERSFAEEARRAAAERAGGLERGGDEWRSLTTVAAVLHGWQPPTWFGCWSDEPPRPDIP